MRLSTPVLIMNQMEGYGMYPEVSRIAITVIAKEKNLPSLQWKLDCIVEMHPGKYMSTRVISIRTTNSMCHQVWICILTIRRFGFTLR